MPTPTAKSGAERRLDSVHSDAGEPVTSEDVHEQQVQTERDLARLIADHPLMSMTDSEILDAAEYDADTLRETAADLYPAQFGGEESD